MTKMKEIFFSKETLHLFVKKSYKYIDLGLSGSRENHQAFIKMLIALFNLKSLIVFLSRRHFHCPGF
jgi:hypothetical protein